LKLEEDWPEAIVTYCLRGFWLLYFNERDEKEVRKMVKVELTEGDRDMLQDVLRKHLTELSWEIAFTQSRDSIKFLKKRKEFIEGFVHRLAS
jgi:hypothetical protein